MYINHCIFYPLFIRRPVMDLYSNDIPSMNNIYSSRYWDKVKEDEQERSNKLYEDAKTPYKTGIVAKPSDSQMFKRNFYNEIENVNDTNDTNDNVVFSLTGEKMTKSSFAHNNMAPFLRKNVTQNTNIESMSPMLDNRTGNNQYWQTKKEVPCMFKPTINSGGNICGMKNNDEFFKSRLEVDEKANNFFPIEKIRVGPGLNQGFNAESSGGFQQADTREYANPRSLDDLRSKINQKQTYFEIPVKGHAKGTDQRGEIAPFTKHRPDTVYEQTEDMWIKTTGATTKETLRPSQNIRPTTRQVAHVEYTGVVSRNDINKGVEDDYGKSKIMVYNNERESTESKTVVSNVTSIVKAIVSPIMDALKYSMKEYTVEAERAVGNPSIQIPSKATLYDPVNHIMKTTVKETTIHDTEMANLTGSKETYSALTDLAKTTVKETLIHDSVLTNIKAGDTGYVVSEDEAKKTLRQTMPAIDSIRNIGGMTYKVTVYDPDIVAKTTTKETTIRGKSEYGFIGGLLEGIFGGYLTKNVELKNTHKQFLSDTNEYGIAGSTGEHRQTDRSAEENAEIDGTRETLLIAAGHTPNPSGVNIMVDSSEVEMTTRKPFENSISAREKGNVGMIYQTSPTMDNCGVTKMPDKSNAYTNRLDSSLLEAITTNDFMATQKINPIKSGCKF